MSFHFALCTGMRCAGDDGERGQILKENRLGEVFLLAAHLQKRAAHKPVGQTSGGHSIPEKDRSLKIIPILIYLTLVGNYYATTLKRVYA